MMQLIGAVLITGCGCWFGEQLARELRQRRQTLDGITVTLEQMRRELEFRQIPLPELFEKLERTACQPVSGLFLHWKDKEDKKMAEEWEERVEKLPLLTQEERYTISSLGGILGRYPVREQGEAIGTVCTYLRQCEEQADKEYARMGKVYRGLGAACGGILVVLLL